MDGQTRIDRARRAALLFLALLLPLSAGCNQEQVQRGAEAAVARNVDTEGLTRDLGDLAKQAFGDTVDRGSEKVPELDDGLPTAVDRTDGGQDPDRVSD